jgi:hypothetical protein
LDLRVRLLLFFLDLANPLDSLTIEVPGSSPHIFTGFDLTNTAGKGHGRGFMVFAWQMSNISHGVGHAINENKGVRLLPPANRHVSLPGHAEIG